MIEFLLWTEPIVTFFFLNITLLNTHNYKQKHIPRYASLLLWTTFFAIVYKPIEIITGNFYLYYLTMFILGLTYVLVFTKSNLPITLTILITYIFCISSAKTIIDIFLQIDFVPSSYFFNRILFYILFYVLMLLSSIFLQTHPLYIPQYFPMKYWFCIILTPTLISIAENIYGTSVPNNIVSVTIAFSLFTLLFFVGLMTYFLSYIVTKTTTTLFESQIINHKLELQLNYVERSSEIIEQIRRDKHEMKNVYFYIQSLIKSNQFKELETFVDTKLVHRFDELEEFSTGNHLIDFLLTQKISEAKEYNIRMMTNINIPAKLTIEENDLCGLLLNLIDNAIAASKDEINGDIHISIRKIKNYLDIEVKNKSTENILSINPLLQTTKTDKENHGFGIRIIDSIVQKYNGIKNIRMDACYFVVNIMLQLPF